MNFYNITVHLYGEAVYTPDNVPWEWQGSGIYDISVDYDTEAVCSVIAETEERAREMVERYDFDDKANFYVQRVEIISCVLELEDEFDIEEIYEVTVEYPFTLPEPEYDD